MGRDISQGEGRQRVAAGQAHRRRDTNVLLLVLVVAAATRLTGLTTVPPGLQQDEAINAWDAYCLLETGEDSNGASWPRFYLRGFGSNRSPLFVYLLLPFQALGGLGVWTTRLPSALAGIAAVALIFLVGRRLFDAPVGLAAAALLAVSPWAIQQSRWANEAAMGALLVLLPLAVLLAAELPFASDGSRPPRPAVALAAGALAGVACYGYFSVRLFLPAFLVAAVAVNRRAWWRCLQTPVGARAIAAAVLAVAATAGPLLWRHLSDPETMNLRGRQTYVWAPEDSLPVKVAKVFARYPGHFGPGFLFLHGDALEFQTPPGGGMLRWYMLPLLVAGAVILALRARASAAARIVLVAVALYPIGDLVADHEVGGMHALRSLPGLPGLVLLAAVGAVEGHRWLAGRRPALARTALLAVAAMAVLETGRFLRLYFVEHPRRPAVYHAFHADLVAASRWLKPQLERIDAVFCTPTEMNMPYVVLLVTLGHDPDRWASEPRTVISTRGWDFYVRAGRLNFLYSDAWQPGMRELTQNGRPDRVVFLLRPNELGHRRPAEVISGPPGTQQLLIFERTL